MVLALKEGVKPLALTSFNNIFDELSENVFC